MFIALSINLSIYRISIFRCIYCYLIIALFIFYQLLFDIFTDFFFIYLVIDSFIYHSVHTKDKRHERACGQLLSSIHYPEDSLTYLCRLRCH